MLSEEDGRIYSPSAVTARHVGIQPMWTRLSPAAQILCPLFFFLTRLPVMIEAVGRAVSIETETINCNMDSIMEKLTALQRKIDGFVDQNGQMESSRGIGMRLLAPWQNNRNLIFFGSPYQPRPRLLWKMYPGKSTAVRRSCFLPHSTDIDYKLLQIHTYIKICTHLPSPDPSPPSLEPPAWQAGLRRNSGCGTGWLLAGAGFCCKVVCSWCMCFCAEVSFPVLTLYSPRSIVWGLFFFSPHLPHVMLYFFLPLSTCISLLIIPCMIMYVTNNKEPWTLKRRNLSCSG